MREFFHIGVLVTAGAFDVRVHRVGEGVPIDVERYLSAVPIHHEIAVVVALEAIIILRRQ
jgi:hypothetical protein